MVFFSCYTHGCQVLAVGISVRLRIILYIIRTLSPTVEAYLSCGQNMNLQHVALALSSCGQLERFLQRKAVVCLTLFITASVLFFKNNLLSWMTPRCWAFEVSKSVIECYRKQISFPLL